MKSHRLKPSHNAVSTAMVNHESTIPSEMHVSTESEYRMDEKDSRSKVVYTGLEVLDVHASKDSGCPPSICRDGSS